MSELNFYIFLLMSFSKKELKYGPYKISYGNIVCNFEIVAFFSFSSHYI